MSTEPIEQVQWVYVTCGSAEEAERIARTLVQERLAACANVLGAARSYYWWEGTLHEDQEVVFVCKTTAAARYALTERICSLHSYAVPAIVFLDVVDGNPEFLRWVRGQISAQGAGAA